MKKKMSLPMQILIALVAGIAVGLVCYFGDSALAASSTGNRPALLKMLANTRPMTQAMAVVQRK